jgi:hypothetical protein
MNVVAFLAICLVALAVGQPSGSYCGSYMMGTISGKLTFSGAETMSLEIDALGSKTVCENEKIMLTGSQVALPGAENVNDCLYKLLTNNNINIKATYDARLDQFSLDAEISTITLSKC